VLDPRAVSAKEVAIDADLPIADLDMLTKNVGE